MRQSQVNSIVEAAKKMSKMFERKVGNNGNKFLSLKDERDDWMQDICRGAHNGMLPDDYKYEYIQEAIDLIANDADTFSELEDMEHEIEADCYTSKLTEWLASSNSRIDYVNVYLEDTGTTDIIDALGGGQLVEKREVYRLVLQGLLDIVDTLEESA